MEKPHFNELRSDKIAKTGRKHPALLYGCLLLLSLMLVSFAMAEDTAEYDASAVDSPPKIVRQMPITYPPDAKRNRVEGRVVVRVLIGTKGKADKMEVAESEPEGVFDEAAIKSLKNWQFRPGILGGELVATWVKIPLSFKLD